MKLFFTIITLFIGFITFSQNNFSLEFDGVDDKLDFGYIDSFDPGGDVTFEAWVKPYSVPTESNYEIFVLGGNGHLFLKYNNDESFIFVITLTGNTNYYIYSDPIYSPNQWYHVAAVYDNLNNIGYLYINGELVGSINTPDDNFYIPNSNNSNIGSYYQPFYGRYFHGAISSAHLTQDIVYTNNFCTNITFQQTSNTIGLWLMDEGSGTNVSDTVNSFDGTLNGPTWISDFPSTDFPEYIPLNGLNGWWPFSGNANDLSGYENNGTINGTTLTTDRFGCPNRAYSFDGIDDNIELDEPYFEGAINVSEFTFSYWVYLNTLPQVSDTYEVLHFNSYWRQKHSGIGENGEIHFGGANSNPNEYFGLTSSNNIIVPNQWYNIIVTYLDSTLMLYLDGILISTEIISQSSLDFSKVISGNSNGKNLFGSRTSVSDGESEFLDGKIDDIGVWNRALTNCEILDIANSELNSINITLTATGNSITANQDGAVYQWLDCNNSNTPITGEINQEFIPTVSGSYAVEINYNGCIMISECFVFEFLHIQDESINEIKVFPNPANSNLYFKANNNIDSIEIYNFLGQQIMTSTPKALTEEIDMSNLQVGMYLVKVTIGKQTATYKVLKQ